MTTFYRILFGERRWEGGNFIGDIEKEDNDIPAV
jgi:hypothetical protein